ncbi:sulfotransferase family protein [Alteromonas ponticola]|uniref:Sulfotransferase family protein n=1 Tax=Alteromonas aquimaris TaxID=2998417 RepID=A0ABT3P4D3_9ALTE|nr:sulfotransferase family protein [Alteromonas aquimaris]MCW8107614.1 sulfotransferase family protein [Alteromonas aquimaris]
MDNKLVVVLGMHRSGTSVIASLVEQCGISTGNNLQEAGPDNPKGYWEDATIVGINNRLLNSLNKSWYSLTWLSLDDIQISPLFIELKQQAIAYLTSMLKKHGDIVVKDPRMATLLPFWVEVFTRLNVEVQYVITKRNPMAIAKSLYKRDSFDIEYATQLIFLNWASIVQNLPESASSTIVDFEEVALDELTVKEALSSFLNCSININTPARFEKLLVHNNPDLLQSGFIWQQRFMSNFPYEPVDEQRILSLSLFYHALNVAYLQPMHQKYVINEIKRIADSYKHKRVVLYGASELASALVGQLFDSIILAVDYAAIDDHQINRFGLFFRSPKTLAEVAHDVILVAVAGRKAEIMKILSQFSNKKIVFVDELLFKK